MVEKNIEEALSIIWELKEKSENTTDHIDQVLSSRVEPGTLEILLEKKYVRKDGSHIAFMNEGEVIARDIIRRERLAERLLTDVLEIDQKRIAPFACDLEHTLAKEVEESICTLLGHPRQCPHGYPIPEGACCKKAKANVESIVSPLSQLRSGQQGKVVYVLTGKHAQLHRLMSFGIVPGSVVRVHQTFPSFILQVGETQIAVEKEVAEHIYVKKA